MRKLKEVLRLRFGLGLQQNQIARSCSLGQATFHRYLHKAAVAGLSWPLPDDLDDRRLEELLFPAVVGRPSHAIRSLPDFAEIRRNHQSRRALAIFEGRHVTFHPVAQILTERGARKGVRTGAENSDEQRGRHDVAGARVMEWDGVASPVHEHLLAGAVFLAQNHFLCSPPALI